MINLVPPAGRKTTTYEYVLRVGSVLGFLFSGVLILLTVALIPTYVLVDAQIKAFETEKAQLVGSEGVFTEADYEVQLTKEALAQLKRVPSSVKVSEVITEIKTIAPQSVVFTNFIANTTNGTLSQIQIRGQAPTREALAELKNVIETSDMFETAEVPIADLARDVEVPFAITVTLSKK